ncbi:glutamyl-tRNA amidotransferase subunit A, putative [Babesia ovata]|uniref:Glutamyl-tRNA amidotransferase subunit A, putative n=1 Tax=Babesia ovata TaxID=189622 RepID=A0A2H6KJL3_9APIC|nr:glutamyl-tRNA amidotransferase subunit A, putative [Babesia ovata]GBE63171.1 glutamyl-tRNA amidotransferase subunit A, putative [Babesia ovata]
MKERHHPVAEPVKVRVHDAVARVAFGSFLVTKELLQARAQVRRFGGVWGKTILGQGGSEAVREVGGQGEGSEEAKEGDEGGRWVEVRGFRGWRWKVENEDLGEGRRRRR